MRKLFCEETKALLVNAYLQGTTLDRQALRNIESGCLPGTQTITQLEFS